MSALPPNHRSRVLPLFHGLKVCIDKELDNREQLGKALAEHGACLSDELDDEDTVHVVAVFGGELFDELRRRGARIVGAPCVFESIRGRKPLPDSKHPVYSRALEGLCVTTTGLSQRKKAELETLIHCLSGIYAGDLTNRTDYLVASEVGSEKYFVACQQGIPVVRVEWLLACWRECTRLPAHNEFLLPPLAGLTICVTGLSAGSRQSVQRLVSQHGGRYSPDLTRKCTHLLAYACEGNKFQYASFWRIPVIRPEWLAECINTGVYVDPRPFLLSPQLPLPSHFAALSLPNAGAAGAGAAARRNPTRSRLALLSRSHSTTALDVIGEPDAAPELAARLALATSPSTSPRDVCCETPPPAAAAATATTAPIEIASSPARDVCQSVSCSPPPLSKRPSDDSLVADLEALVASCDAVLAAVLTTATVCSLLQRADVQARPDALEACLEYAAAQLDVLHSEGAFSALPPALRACITTRAHSPVGKKRRTLTEE